jgi:putative PIN family toxin of toxin-antitoxin system
LRAVLDPNVIISALLSPSGSPAQLLRAWQQGAFELIVSLSLLTELERALTYPKLRKKVEPEEAQRVLQWLSSSAIVAEDPSSPPSVRSPDPGDDYLTALAQSEGAALVSGDGHLLQLAGTLPVFSPAQFLHLLET